MLLPALALFELFPFSNTGKKPCGDNKVVAGASFWCSVQEPRASTGRKTFRVLTFFPTFPILPLFSRFVEFCPPSQCNEVLCELLKKKVEVFAHHGIATGRFSLMF